jgi:SAM-dependent methyltransferase
MTRRGSLTFVNAVLDRAFERWLGVRTAEGNTRDDGGSNASNQAWYTPSEWIPTRRALASLHPSGDDVLVDYGCGLGRALVVARTLPFRRVIGVEVTPALAAAARGNLARQRRWVRCESAEVLEADAAAWPFPDEATVVYMYSPFTGPIFAAAVDRLLESLERRPRRLRLVYTNPAEHNYLIHTGRFRPVDVIPATWPATAMVTVTYEVLPETVDDSSGDARLGPWASYTDRVPKIGETFEPAFRS